MSAGPHAVVIGGGPAGSAAAHGLARAGWRATLIEARAFPRPKACGEFISPAATDLLESLVPAAALRAAGAQRLHDLVLELDQREVRWRMPRPAWSIGRETLDTLLLEAARGAGTTIMQPAAVEGVTYDDAGVRVRVRGVGEIDAGIVVHADGSGRHDPAGPVPVRRGVVALKCHVMPPRPVDGLHMRCARGGYIGLAPVGDGLATCALVASARLAAAYRGDTDAMVRSMWTAFDPAWRTTPWLACGVPGSAYIAPGHVRSFRIGNAAAGVEPVGGEGIGLALWSGDALARLLGTGMPLALVQRRLAAMYRRRLRIRRPACRLAAAVLSRPAIARALWPTLAAPGLLLRPWYALTGKPLSAAAS